MATNVIKTPLVIATHVRKFNSTSRLKDKNKGAAIGSVGGKVYQNNGSTTPQLLDTGGANQQGYQNTAVVPLTGSAWITGTQGVSNVLAWQNPVSGVIIIERVFVYVSTPSTNPASLAAGTAQVSPTLLSNDLIYADSMQVIGVYSNLNRAATELVEQVLTVGGWITFTAIGNPAGVVATAYIRYFVA